MLQALDYLEYRQLIHRDVKPENILFTRLGSNYIFQLSDFGLANHMHKSTTRCGTEAYMAPELVDGSHTQSPKMDIWALFMVVGHVLQEARLHLVFECTSHHDVWNRVDTAVSKNPMHEISAMARRNPAIRASAAQMLDHLYRGDGRANPRQRIGPIPDPDAEQASPTDTQGAKQPAAAPARVSPQARTPPARTPARKPPAHILPAHLRPSLRLARPAGVAKPTIPGRRQGRALAHAVLRNPEQVFRIPGSFPDDS